MLLTCIWYVGKYESKVSITVLYISFAQMAFYLFTQLNSMNFNSPRYIVKLDSIHSDNISHQRICCSTEFAHVICNNLTIRLFHSKVMSEISTSVLCNFDT